MGDLASKTTSLSSTQGIVLLTVVAGGALLAGVVVILARRFVGSSDEGSQSESVVRSWIAISLVIGLLVFCAAAFLINDTSLRSTLFGGLVASVGAAVAFYFSSKSADQARSDVLAAIGQGAMKPTKFLHAAPPSAPRDTPYVYRFAANGQAPLSYKVLSGAIPAGLALDQDGTLYGTPSATGDYTFTIQVSNSLGSFATSPLTITVS